MLPRLASAQATATPVDKSAGGGSSHQFRGGCDRSVESHLGGAFEASSLTSGYHRLPVRSGDKGTLAVSGEGVCARLKSDNKLRRHNHV